MHYNQIFHNSYKHKDGTYHMSYYTDKRGANHKPLDKAFEYKPETGEEDGKYLVK